MADQKQIDAIVKARFAEGLSRHVPECPICILRHPRMGCDIGRVLWAGAEQGIGLKKEDGGG